MITTLGKAMTWSPNFTVRPCTYLILQGSSKSTTELSNHFKFDAAINTTPYQADLDMIKQNWDSFCKGGASRLMIDF